MSEILINEIFQIATPEKYKLHLACRNEEGQSPLDAFITNHDDWLEWNEWRGNRNDWTREYIFSAIEFYPKANSWLFGGIFKVIERHSDGYTLEEVNEYKKYVGRVLISFSRYQGLRGRAYYLESFYDSFIISEIFPTRFDGEVFPGYQNINLDFNTLEVIVKNEKLDWKASLINMKGVYLIIDKSNGKKYVGSAYGDAGLWSRWCCYAGTGHGWNDQLTRLIQEKGLSYSRTNFKFSLLEVMSVNKPDDYILERESYWKNILMTREFGYNSN